MKSVFATVSLALALLALPVAATAQGTTWSVPGDFATLQEAVDSPSVASGDTLRVGPGAHAGAVVNKSLEIVGLGGATIVTGPIHPSGMVQGFRLANGSSGTTISHFGFAVDLGVIVATANDVNDVTITQCVFADAVQAITAWGGSRWSINHNDIHDLRSRNGGGIGILIGDWMNRAINDNVIEHNRIDGTLHVASYDGGGYNGTGIVVYADYRWGRTGASQIVRNRIVKNNVALTSDTPAVVDVAAIELTDTREVAGVIYSNAIGFNDLRGTTLQIVVTSGLDNPVNSISRNLGDNRGRGLHPSAFVGAVK